MFWYATIIASIVSFSPRLNRLVAAWMLPALLLFSSDNFFPFRCRLFLNLAYLFFQRFRWALDSGSDAVKLLQLCRDLTLSTLGVPLIALVGLIYKVLGFHVADHWRHIDRPHRSHVAYYGICTLLTSSFLLRALEVPYHRPALAPQPTGRSRLKLFSSCLVVPALKGPP